MKKEEPATNGHSKPTAEEESDGEDSVCAEAMTPPDTPEPEETEEDAALVERLRKALENAISLKNIKKLEKAINNASGHEEELGELIAKAQKLLTKLRNMQEAKDKILKMKRSTLAEVKSYSQPPTPACHTVMKATLLLHGHDLEETEEWDNIRSIVGKTGKENLRRLCVQFDPVEFSAEIAAQAGEMLSALNEAELWDDSAAIGTFYVWSKAAIAECAEEAS